MRRNMKALLFSGFALGLAITACAPKPRLVSNRAQMGSAVGVQLAETTSQQVAQRARLRDQDGKKILEYLDPTSNEEKWNQLGEIETRPAGTQFYHWGPPQDVKYWTTQGISHEDIDRAVRNYDETDMMGGGFYASLSPTDSSSYGESLLVIRPKEEVITLDLTHVGANYNRDMKAIQVSYPVVLVPVALIAEAGVQTMRYTETWMVCISGKPLENLLEGSWDTFMEQNKITKFDLATVLTLSMKYPLTPEVYSRPEFVAAFPTVARYFNHQPLSEDDYNQILTSAESDGSILTSLANSEQWKGLWADVRQRLVGRYLPKLKEALAQNDFLTVENNIGPMLGRINLKIHDLLPEQGSLTTVAAGQATFTGALSFKSSPEIAALMENLSLFDFYKALSLAVKGQKEVKTLMGLGKDEQTFSERRMQGFSYTSASLEGMFLGLAKIWGQEKIVLRDKPLMATGGYLLDGPHQPGYIRITEQEKKELQESPFIVPTFREVAKADGGKEYYVRYEHPTAKHFKNMLKYIKDPALLARLQTADQNGDLQSTDPSRSAALTQDMLREVAQNRILENPSATVRNFSDLMKIQPFADPILAEKLIMTYASVQGYRMVFSPDMNVYKVATYLEIVQNTNDYNNARMSLYKTLDKDWAAKARTYIDPQYDFGVWELAANSYGPHKDPAQFLAKVKARFESAEVQDWLRTKSYDRILQALHEAGEGQ